MGNSANEQQALENLKRILATVMSILSAFVEGFSEELSKKCDDREGRSLDEKLKLILVYLENQNHHARFVEICKLWGLEDGKNVFISQTASLLENTEQREIYSEQPPTVIEPLITRENVYHTLAQLGVSSFQDFVMDLLENDNEYFKLATVRDFSEKIDKLVKILNCSPKRLARYYTLCEKFHLIKRTSPYSKKRMGETYQQPTKETPYVASSAMKLPTTHLAHISLAAFKNICLSHKDGFLLEMHKDLFPESTTYNSFIFSSYLDQVCELYRMLKNTRRLDEGVRYCQEH